MLGPDSAIWASMDGNQVNGVMIGAVVPFYFLEGSYATDLVFFADRDGPALFRAFMQWAQARVTRVQLGISSGMDEAGRIGKFYESQGFGKIGGMYLKEVQS